MSGRNANRARIQSADLESKRKPASGLGDELRAHVLLHMPVGMRTVSLPEPVDGDWVNWRPAAWWEEELVRSARLRERRAELALFDGLTG